MNPNTFPTKGNLILAKNSLALATQGYGLMDKKRSILLRELMDLIDQAKDIQSEIDTTFTEAYKALQKANIELGINYVQEISASVPVENGIRIKARSIMGTEIPLVQYEPEPLNLTYAYYSTRESLDEARAKFQKVKELTIKLSMVENSAYRLANNIKKNPEKGQRPEKYHHPHVRDPHQRHHQRTGGKRPGGIYPAEGDQTDEGKRRVTRAFSLSLPPDAVLC